MVSPENFGRNPVRLAQEDGGSGADSGAGVHWAGLGGFLGSELAIITTTTALLSERCEVINKFSDLR